jgi:hypothetical protein
VLPDAHLPTLKHHQALAHLAHSPPAPLPAREIFLRSSALELLVNHFLEEPSLDSEEVLLHHLLQLCLVQAPAERSSGLVDAIIKLGSSMLHPHVKLLSRNMLRDIASQAVGSLKVRCVAATHLHAHCAPLFQCASRAPWARYSATRLWWMLCRTGWKWRLYRQL